MNLILNDTVEWRPGDTLGSDNLLGWYSDPLYVDEEPWLPPTDLPAPRHRAIGAALLALVVVLALRRLVR